MGCCGYLIHIYWLTDRTGSTTRNSQQLSNIQKFLVFADVFFLSLQLNFTQILSSRVSGDENYPPVLACVWMTSVDLRERTIIKGNYSLLLLFVVILSKSKILFAMEGLDWKWKGYARIDHLNWFLKWVRQSCKTKRKHTH